MRLGPHSVYSWGPLLQPAQLSRVLKHLVPGLRFHAEPQILGTSQPLIASYSFRCGPRGPQKRLLGKKWDSLDSFLDVFLGRKSTS